VLAVRAGNNNHMKLAAVIIVLIAIAGLTLAFSKRNSSPKFAPGTVPASFHDFSIAGLNGDTIHMKDFAGKYVLCVNVASRCGFTPQYKTLQALYEQYQDQLVIIGFPCNQFLNQEPGSAEEIANFCEVNFGVTFPLSEKIDVKGSGQHPIYGWLTNKEYNGVEDAKVSWNFNKFLISPEGRWLAHFPSKTDPLSEEITGYLK